MSEMKKTDPVVENEDGTEVEDSMVVFVLKELSDIEETGVEVTKILIRSDGGPPRFQVNFRKGEPMVNARMALEKKYYDVGQNLNGRNISFYVTKRVEQTKGWQV